MDWKRIGLTIEEANSVFDISQEIELSSKKHPVYLETLRNSKDRIVLKSLDEKRYNIYTILSSKWNPFWEPILGTFSSDSEYWAATYFIPKPKKRVPFDYSFIGCESLSLMNLIDNFDYLRARSFFCFISEFEQANNHLIPEHIALSFIYQICEGLKSLHKNGFVHCDVSPQNIILTESPKRLCETIPVKSYDIYPVLIDLGNSSLEQASERQVTSIIGTTAFMAPEVINFKPNDRSDIYSLGCILQYMCLGKAPNETGGLKLLKSSASKPFYKIVKKCTEDYEKRYRTYDDLQRDILNILKKR